MRLDFPAINLAAEFDMAWRNRSQERFNVTFQGEDLYRFRTPPLFNVHTTAPYGHSGSIADLREAIVAFVGKGLRSYAEIVFLRIMSLSVASTALGIAIANTHRQTASMMERFGYAIPSSLSIGSHGRGKRNALIGQGFKIDDFQIQVTDPIREEPRLASGFSPEGIEQASARYPVGR